MKTKPRGIWANFRTTCGCGAEITITNGRIDFHECERITGTLDEVLAALETKGTH